MFLVSFCKFPINPSEKIAKFPKLVFCSCFGYQEEDMMKK